MVATSGDPLLRDDAVATLRDELIPAARIITPNIPEAEILLGRKISAPSEVPAAAVELSQNRTTSVLLKAGHLTGGILTDVFYNAETDETIELSSPRLATRNTHGTGCTLSSAIAAGLARGLDLNQAVRFGKDYITAAITAGAAYTIGHGHGPVHHFYQWWE